MIRLLRYRLVKFLIIAFSVLYLFMVSVKPVVNIDKDEIFPFFSWRLFPPCPAVREAVPHELDEFRELFGCRIVTPATAGESLSFGEA